MTQLHYIWSTVSFFGYFPHHHCFKGFQDFACFMFMKMNWWKFIQVRRRKDYLLWNMQQNIVHSTNDYNPILIYLYIINIIIEHIQLHTCNLASCQNYKLFFLSCDASVFDLAVSSSLMLCSTYISIRKRTREREKGG